MNWQVVGQAVSAIVFLVSGPLIIFIVKKASL
uniref:Ycf12 n=1 Tax=Protohalopteris sp. TaxID=2843287 RepID=A0A8F0F759_9PHAE|nr:hypothetical protein [Protohalopteris sp.]